MFMELQKYPFSEQYGWIRDKYGVSWQLILTNPDGEPRPFIVPSMLFVGILPARRRILLIFTLQYSGILRKEH